MCFIGKIEYNICIYKVQNNAKLVLVHIIYQNIEKYPFCPYFVPKMY